MPLSSGARAALADVLRDAQRAGFLGDGPVEPHIAHGVDFCAAVRWARTQDPPCAAGGHVRVVDLGSGAGLPGLVLALADAGLEVVLLEARERRCAFLGAAIRRLELQGRVDVLHERAESAGRSPEHRGSFDVAVARAFGPPAVTAECAAPLLVVGGHLVVSEPPAWQGSGVVAERWPAGGLGALGMGPALEWEDGHHFAVIRQEHAASDRFPRRVGVAAKRPLF